MRRVNRFGTVRVAPNNDVVVAYRPRRKRTVMPSDKLLPREKCCADSVDYYRYYNSVDPSIYGELERLTPPLLHIDEIEPVATFSSYPAV